MLRRRLRIYALISALVASSLVVGVLAGRDWRPNVSATPEILAPNPDPSVKTVDVDPAADVSKPSEVHGIMGWRFFDLPAGSRGPSRDQLRFRFLAPAEIVQIDISVDISDLRAQLVEFAARDRLSRRIWALSRGSLGSTQASWTRASSHGDLE